MSEFAHALLNRYGAAVFNWKFEVWVSAFSEVKPLWQHHQASLE